MSVALPCDGRNGECGSLAAKLEGDEIAIRHVHHGQVHITRISLRAIYEMNAKRVYS
jgi:hypothetical protein